MFDLGASFLSKLNAKISILPLAVALAFGSSAYAQSIEWEFTTALGDTLVLSPIEGMECGDMDKMLARIDSTRYRENAPTPHDDADAPLFEYELVLAEENYNRCVMVRKKVTGGMIIMRRLKSQ